MIAPLPGHVVVAQDVQASDEPGAWNCLRCGFRGFWRGGAHCLPSHLVAPAPVDQDPWAFNHFAPDPGDES